jgi:CRP-like cAMP-binding protein
MNGSRQNLIQVKAGASPIALAKAVRPDRALKLRPSFIEDPATWVPVASLNAILSALPPGVLYGSGPNIREVSLTAGDVLIEEGEAPKVIHFPGSAVLGCFKGLKDGHVVQLAALGRDEASGLLACLSETAATAQVRVQLSGSAIAVPARVVRLVAQEHPDLLAALLAAAGREVRQIEQNLACNAHHDTTRRMARWLLTLADRSGQADMLLTQDDMALMAGVRRTTVNAGALILRTAGVIRYSRGRIRILDRDGLEAMACPCHRDLQTS